MAFARIFALALMTAAPALVSFDAAAATPEAQAPASKLSIAATVKHDGSTADAKQVAALGETSTLRAASDDHEHDLSITVTKSGDGYAVKLGYTRDGKRIFKSKSATTAGDSLTIDAGKGTSITVALAPAKPKRARIDMPEGDDPLAGL
ncbi:MAG: hypothetical protein AAGA54_17220 [Myxococcota bacterium]